MAISENNVQMVESPKSKKIFYMGEIQPVYRTQPITKGKNMPYLNERKYRVNDYILSPLPK